MQEDLLPVGAVFFFLCVSEVNSLYILLSKTHIRVLTNNIGTSQEVLHSI